MAVNSTETCSKLLQGHWPGDDEVSLPASHPHTLISIDTKPEGAVH